MTIFSRLADSALAARSQIRGLVASASLRRHGYPSADGFRDPDSAPACLRL